MAEVTDVNKHTNLLLRGINYDHIKFYCTGPWGRIHNTQFYLQLMSGSSKLKNYITLGWKGWPVTDSLASLQCPLVSYEENEEL